MLITTPILAAEFMLGQSGRGRPPAATGAVALAAGRSSRWSVIGWFGTLAMMAYGAYVPRGVSLLRSGAVISASIVVALILASLISARS